MLRSWGVGVGRGKKLYRFVRNQCMHCKLARGQLRTSKEYFLAAYCTCRNRPIVSFAICTVAGVSDLFHVIQKGTPHPTPYGRRSPPDFFNTSCISGGEGVHPQASALTWCSWSGGSCPPWCSGSARWTSPGTPRRSRVFLLRQVHSDRRWPTQTRCPPSGQCLGKKRTEGYCSRKNEDKDESRRRASSRTGEAQENQLNKNGYKNNGEIGKRSWPLTPTPPHPPPSPSSESRKPYHLFCLTSRLE